MNFIQKIPKIFAIALDDKDLYILFFEILLIRVGIEKKGPNVFFDPFEDRKKYNMWDMTRGRILYKVIVMTSHPHRDGTFFINSVPDKNA